MLRKSFGSTCPPSDPENVPIKAYKRQFAMVIIHQHILDESTVRNCPRKLFISTLLMYIATERKYSWQFLQIICTMPRCAIAPVFKRMLFTNTGLLLQPVQQ